MYNCVSFQIIVQSGGQNRQFTFDYVFPPEASQEELYTTAVSKIIKEIHNGFNVTILAYGQTGSGKTYSMGTNSPENCPDETMGIIPRAIRDMFSTITEREDEYQYLLYAENLYDLLAPGPRDDNILDIREGVGGEIRMQGVTEVPVASLQETMRCLEQGSHHRATGSTAMNAQSSRSHALFCVTLQQWKKQNSDHVVCAKFTLVDLAGSERAKKTGTTGQRFKEGIHINSGLLCLGKVISALGSGKEKHIPYRESKLTRLLQDSLGGNSHTLMVACVSPADNSLEETLSTLAYADRARMIKNKPMVNCDPKAAEIARLKQQV
ncbi:hypothetical protein HAZT_HAZT000086 [Hyalella azteca]|uniref:Kinesin-like protein n=1 Tax=Hyalella azteca TaxID=294128 RepID=A0A6A0H2N4_HYAAZ|nr:hypothetical protein HAZT_HAZT000086 [Hyalella azteca]